MNLTLTPKQLLSELPAFHAANLVPYVMSAPGIGKSSIFRQYAQSVGLPHVDTRLAYAAPTDVRGLPFLKNDAMTYAVPAEYPTEASVWTLEELPCAARTVQVAALQLTLERCIGDYCVPDGTLLSVTGNRAVDKAHVERMSSAVINRLVLITLAPSIEDWTEWAFGAGVDPRIVAFLRFRPELLSQFDGAKWDGYSAFPSPRSWEMAARYVVASGGASPHASTILSGIVGQAAAMELHGFLQVFGRIPSIDGILLDPDGSPVPTKPDERYAIAAALVGRTNEKSFGVVSRYLARMPKDFEVFTIKAAIQKCPAIQHSPEFIRWFSKNTDVIVG